MADEERDAGLRLAIEGDVNRVEARRFELHLLEIDNEVAGAEVHVVGERDLNRDGREVLHDGAAIGVDEVELEVVFPFVSAGEGDAQGDGALRMHRGELLGVNSIKGSQQIELPVIIGRRIAQHGHLNIHPGCMEARNRVIRTNFFCRGWQNRSACRRPVNWRRLVAMA